MTAPETIGAKIDRLTHELSDALNEFMDGEFRAIVEPSERPNCQVWLQNMRQPIATEPTAAAEKAPPPAFDLQRWLDTTNPKTVAEYHAFQLARALNRHTPGFWRAKIMWDDQWAFVVREPHIEETGPLIEY